MVWYIYDDTIYVCDTMNNCVVKLNKELQKLDSYGTLGMENGNFSKPMDITFSQGFFYVLDSGNNRIQKFSLNFEHVETYNLKPLLSEQGCGEYLSIVVNEQGVLYISVFSPDTEDAYVYCFKNDEWNRIGKNTVGYLCKGNKSVYFASMLEFFVQEKKTTLESGKNMLYEIDSERIKQIANFQEKYVPVALSYWNNSIYMISAGEATLNVYTFNSRTMETLLVMPEVSLFMYMSIDSKGNIYITDNENGNFYCVHKKEN